MVAGAVVNLATFNEIAPRSCSKLTRMKVKMTATFVQDQGNGK